MALTILILALLVTATFAQNDASVSSESALTKKQNSGSKRANLYYHLGSIELPNDFSGEVTANWNDAWAGILRSKGDEIKIGWRAGTIEYLREKRKNDIELLRTEIAGTNVYEVAELKEATGKTLVAKIGWLEFSCKVKSDEQEKVFWSILATYEKERCKTCISLPIKVVN